MHLSYLHRDMTSYDLTSTVTCFPLPTASLYNSNASKVLFYTHVYIISLQYVSAWMFNPLRCTHLRIDKARSTLVLDSALAREFKVYSVINPCDLMISFISCNASSNYPQLVHTLIKMLWLVSVGRMPFSVASL